MTPQSLLDTNTALIRQELARKNARTPSFSVSHRGVGQARNGMKYHIFRFVHPRWGDQPAHSRLPAIPRNAP
ncbi:hypothetical protein GCM10008955_31370 [Deinococcus malanensis]|uniref:Uncharacterized protein n=1 Tax=Deinococcus malanensis TaxID=1706855 RepID=A0ABQ2EZA2_9DEIO|nr:hypothetical protein GCM10008955_31370 [Deinococcus malanensis]